LPSPWRKCASHRPRWLSVIHPSPISVRLGLSTVQLYLSRWGFTPQKPLSRATQRSDAAIARWLDQEYPKIARRAKREKALIFWGDETGVSNQDQVGRGYAPKGQTPVVPAYTPEHNPDEYLNNDLKQQLKNQPKPNTQEDLVKATAAVLRSLQRRPERIRSYFNPPQVRYAA